MIPKKIYLRKAELEDNYMCERMVSCDVAIGSCNVEYTDLSQVWHDVAEEPMDRRRTIVLYGTNPVGVTSCNYEDILLTFRETWSAYVFLSNFSLWAYLDELLPKGGEK